MIRQPIVGYADRLSVRPGEPIAFKVSCDEGVGRYRAEIVRVVCGDDQPEGPGFKERAVATAVDGEYPARAQAIATGSYVLAPAGPAVRRLASFTIAAMIWPTTPAKGWQGLLGWWSEPTEVGFGLFIDGRGETLLAIGDGRGGVQLVRSGKKLGDRAWYLVAGSFDAATGEAVLIQEPLLRHATVDDAALVRATSSVRAFGAPNAPVSIGPILTETASGVTAGGIFNGRIDSPRIASRALDRAGIERLVREPLTLTDALVAAWDFGGDMGSSRTVDLSPNALHGTLVNLPTRAVRGYRWTGVEMNWTHAPDHYSAIHFHDDDLYDAGWETDFTLRVPADLPSGSYAAKLTAGDAEDYVPFFVPPPKGTATAPLALLIPTASYLAYANFRESLDYPAAELGFNMVATLGARDLYINDHPELGLSMYDHHADGSGVAYSSGLRPILNLRPRHTLWQYNADTHLTDWLEAKGHAFDVITDGDLHAEGLGLLERYACVMTGTHPEYYSTPMWDAVHAYINRGGRLIYTGANGFYWRIAYSQDRPGAIEMRRAEGGSRSWFAEPGEYHMSFTGELGGLWQRQGRAPQSLVGTGFAAQGFDLASYYRRKPDSRNPRAAWIFEGVDEEIIGDFGLVGGGAAGWEIDRVERRHGTPPHALVLASSEGHTDTYLIVTEEIGHNYPTTLGRDHPDVRADMVFFEMPGGGAVFSTSSICWGGSLAHNRYDNNVSRITDNVIRRFVDPKPFPGV
ncbi:MAG: N,N-dimethylformamidase [Alphaproteobacteria bacterium]|nr:N,N-dimethylformamidase [Alphaproteobacteria bacterium]